MIELEQTQQFDRDGFLILENLFSGEEVEILLNAVTGSERVGTHAIDVPDSGGVSSKLALWRDLGDDVFGIVSRSQRVVTIAQMLLREEIYHWHSKVMLKEAKVGGVWEWHQDYGYWYRDNCLFPRMVSCMIALDPATKENGCLKVIPGSHHLGRLEHGRVGNQTGADRDRVAEVEKRLGVRYCEVGAGSALFFHGNLLHSSEANRSDHHRRAYICCYNALSNVPYGEGGHGKPEPITVLPDDAIVRWSAQQ